MTNTRRLLFLITSFIACLNSHAQNLDNSLSFWERVNRRAQPGYNDGGSAVNTRFLVGILGSDRPSQTKITHIVVAGSGLGVDSDQFFQSALLRGKIYRELYPHHQLIIASQPDVVKATQEEVFKRYNVRIVATEKKRFTAYQLHRLMSKFKKIASFDFYGHSSPWALRLGQRNASMYASPKLATLKEHFISGAYCAFRPMASGIKGPTVHPL